MVEITPALVARIELLGACADCSMINMTLKGGVESALKKAAPELTAIEAINLHDANQEHDHLNVRRGSTMGAAPSAAAAAAAAQKKKGGCEVM